MDFSNWIVTTTGLPASSLFGPNGLVQLAANADGSIAITKWSVPNVAQPTAAQIAAIVAQPTPVNATIVKQICTDFIYSYADTNTQMNATALIASGQATAAQVSAYQEALAWIKACRTQYAALLASNDTDYAKQSATYPAPSQDVLNFINSL